MRCAHDRTVQSSVAWRPLENDLENDDISEKYYDQLSRNDRDCPGMVGLYLASRVEAIRDN